MSGVSCRVDGKARRSLSRPAVCLTLSLLAASVAGCSAGGADDVASVAKGSVRATIDATGALQYLTQQKLGFPEGGKLVSLKVAVGDHVVSGQELAAVDNTQQQVNLRKANAAVAKAQALLNRMIAGNDAVFSLRESGRVKNQIDQSGRVLDETDHANSSAVNQAKNVLAFDQKDVRIKQDQFDQINVPSSQCFNGQPTQMLPVNTGYDPCQQYFNRFEALQDAKRRVVQDKSDIRAAQRKYDVDHESQQSITEQYKLNQQTLQDKADLTTNTRPFDIAGYRADVDSAAADQMLTQKAFDATIMHSSFNGTVGQINGSVGEVLNASEVTPLFPGGGDAPDAKPAAATDPKVAGDSFIVIRDVNAFQVSAPFSPIDAAKMQVGQPSEVTFDEIPGLTRQARVSSIVPADPQVKDSNYIVKLALTEADPRMHDGMIAQAHVITSSTDNVLVVPTDAVVRKGQSGTVSLVGQDGSRRDVPVELGAIGAATTQIVSGVREGDQVALKTN